VRFTTVETMGVPGDLVVAFPPAGRGVDVARGVAVALTVGAVGTAPVVEVAVGVGRGSVVPANVASSKSAVIGPSGRTISRTRTE
jgi:hypothetical protein